MSQLEKRAGARRFAWRRWEFLIVSAGTMAAFFLALSYLSTLPLGGVRWAETRLGPAVNYACTGHFGNVPWDPNFNPSSLQYQLWLFLTFERADLPCSLFPHDVPAASFFDGIDTANVEMPLYLMGLFGLLWRLFGVSWVVTDYILAASSAAAFLIMYLCARRFTNAPVAALIALFLLATPLYITNNISPRDALKFPFIMGIGALLVGYAAMPRRPTGFLLFAGIVGLIIGIGYGFRSDLLYFLLPVSFIVCLLGQINFATPVSTFNRALANTALRIVAVAALVLSFAIGGWMPLLNDYYFHDYYGDVGYHPMAMGQLGQLRGTLYLNSGPGGRMYMYRNSYSDDLSVGVRVLEYAARRDGRELAYAEGPYWTYAKRYYLSIIKVIPADLLSGAIGAFISVTTLPYSLTYRQAEAPRYDASAPWTSTYKFARNTIPYLVANWLDKINLFLSNLPIGVLFAINLVVLFQLLCLIAYAYGLRGLLSALALFASMIFVTSLKFELRHVFYVYVLFIFGWSIVLVVWACAAWRVLGRLLSRKPLRSTTLLPSGQRINSPIQSVLIVTAAIAGLCLVAYGTLSLARLYQVSTLRSTIADLIARPMAPAEFTTSPLNEKQLMLRVLSPVPLSTGGTRLPDAPINGRIHTMNTEMGVIAATFDGKACQHRVIDLLSVHDTYMPTPDPSPFALHETFSIRLDGDVDYVALLPTFYAAFLYRRQNGTDYFAETKFSGLALSSEDVHCIKNVSFITAFKRDDLLFDFFVPKYGSQLKADDLFERVIIPGIGLL
jgi:hypothetical protein